MLEKKDGYWIVQCDYRGCGRKREFQGDALKMNNEGWETRMNGSFSDTRCTDHDFNPAVDEGEIKWKLTA